MKTPDPTTVSDLLKLGETALSALLGAAKEMKAKSRDHCDSLVRQLDLVTREEFDAAFAMLKKARTVQSDLEKRIADIEKKLSVSSPQKHPSKKQLNNKK